MPESIRSFGVTSAPAARMISDAGAGGVLGPAASRQVTPTARPFSMHDALDRARCSLSVSRGSSLSGSMKAWAALRALAAAVGELVEADAALGRAVEIAGEGLAHRLHRLDKPARDVVDMPGIGYQQRPVAVVHVRRASGCCPRCAGNGQHGLPVPGRALVVAAQDARPTRRSRRAGRACRPARSPTTRRRARCPAECRGPGRPDAPAARCGGRSCTCCRRSA